MAKSDSVNCDALLIGGSAGSLEVILKILPDIFLDITFAIIIILHRKAGSDYLLADLLSSKTRLEVKEAEEKETIMNATIYLAPPNYHLLFEKDRTFSFDASEKVNFSRPSIDVSFQSAAEVYREKLVCVLLSGANADGAEGLQWVKNYGGKALVQDPGSAVMPFMPEFARMNVQLDEILLIEQMAAYINSLSKRQ